MKKVMGIALGVIVILFGIAAITSGPQAGDRPVACKSYPYLTIAGSTGITITTTGSVIAWTDGVGGKTKLQGPLAGKKIGLVVGCEFSDWQAYYFASFIAEFGGRVQFVMDNNHLWKETRPMRGVPTEPHGMWGLSLSGGMAGLGITGNKADPPALMQPGVLLAKDYPVAKPGDYDAIIILGGHSGDILYADDVAINFIKAVADRQVPIAAIGAGILPLIKLKLVNGRRVTGNRVVDYMLEKIATFTGSPVETDTSKKPFIITGRDTVDAPAVLRALCKAFDSSFVDRHKGILKGKKTLAMLTGDWEDIELCAPTLELLYRGATYLVGLFDQDMKSRPALSVTSKVREGSFGTSVPFQEIPLSYYKIIPGEEVRMHDFDLVWIPGAMNPWQITVLHLDFLRHTYQAGKIVASICHGPIPVAAAGLAQGKHMTGWLACEDSVNIMGGTFKPEWAAAIDGRIVTGRTPPEVPEFIDAITAALLCK